MLRSRYDSRWPPTKLLNLKVIDKEYKKKERKKPDSWLILTVTSGKKNESKIFCFLFFSAKSPQVEKNGSFN